MNSIDKSVNSWIGYVTLFNIEKFYIGKNNA